MCNLAHDVAHMRGCLCVCVCVFVYVLLLYMCVGVCVYVLLMYMCEFMFLWTCSDFFYVNIGHSGICISSVPCSFLNSFLY